MNDHDDDERLDAMLRDHWAADEEPADGGFSLRVMAALPAQPAPGRQRRARWLRLAHWLAMSLAAFGTAALTGGWGGPLDLPHALAALALVALLIFWSVPNRWSRG